MIPADLTPATIWVSRPQQKILHPVFNWIRKHEAIDDWTTALDICCVETIDDILQLSWDPIIVPTEGPTKPFRFLRSSHPADTTDAAIGIANEEIGLDDEGAALTAVAATFVLKRPEIATSPSRKMRAIYRKMLHLKAEQAGGPK